MRALPLPRARLAALGLAGATIAGALTACGGGAEPPPAQATAAAQAAPTAVAPSPLFDAQGRPLPSPRDLQPAATAARTRHGLYATREQLAWEELLATTTTIVIDLDANGSVAGAVRLAEQVRYWHGSQALAFFVRGRDAVAVAQVVDQLADAGFGTVFAVV